MPHWNEPIKLISRLRLPLHVCIIGLLLQNTAGQIPDCLKNAVTSGKVSCNGEDLTQMTSAEFNRIPGLTQLTEILTVELINTRITSLEFMQSSHLRKVKTLILDGVIGLTDEHFSDLSGQERSLETLSLINMAELQSIDSLANIVWRNLATLRVNYCGITLIDPNVIGSIQKPNEFDFNNNQLEELDFRDADNDLQIVRARENRLTAVKNLRKLFNLRTLDLAENQLSSDIVSDIDSLLRISYLSTLDLSGNSLTSFQLDETRIDTDTRDILLINLEDNNIAAISQLGRRFNDILNSYVKKVKTLKLSRNKNLKLEYGTLKGLPKLTSLKMIDCGLTRITTHLQNLTALQTLQLQQNQLVDMSTEVFAGTTALQKLMLQNNRLTELAFMSSTVTTLRQLSYLDISHNQLDNLQNFVAAPQLRDLRMNGSPDSNRFSQLSACTTFQKIPKTLRVVCATNIASDDCFYRSFVDLLRSQVLYNNKECCDDPNNECCRDTKSCRSNWPPSQGCEDKQRLCEQEIIRPVNPTKPGSNHTTICEPKPRESFEELQSAEIIVMVLGYVLAVIFFIIMFVLFIRRYRSYDKWLHDYRDNETMNSTGIHPPIHTRVSDASLDMVDSPSPSTSKGVRASPINGGTLPRGSPKVMSKSLDNLSMSSDASHYSTIGKGTFSGRNKFRDNAPMPIEMDRYTSPGHSHMQSNDSGENSPTTLSVYSYASHQPERSHREVTPPAQRRRHRSGGNLPPARHHRSHSHDDVLDSVSIDSDLLPSPIKIQLQREATLKGAGSNDSGITRNSRSYSSAPHRAKGRSKKKPVSPLLTVQRVHKNPGAPTPPASRRALPATPTSASGSRSPHSMRSGSSLASSGGSRRNDFAMDDDDNFITFEETEGYGD